MKSLHLLAKSVALIIDAAKESDGGVIAALPRVALDHRGW
jgi:hypothetical protein